MAEPSAPGRSQRGSSALRSAVLTRFCSPFRTHLCNGSVTDLTISNVSFVTHAPPARGQQAAAGLDTQHPSAHTRPSSHTHLRLVTHSLTHQVMTTSFGTDTLIDRFAVLPRSFKPTFTDTVTLLNGQRREDEREGLPAVLKLNKEVLTSPVQDRRRRRWHWGGSLLCRGFRSC